MALSEACTLLDCEPGDPRIVIESSEDGEQWAELSEALVYANPGDSQWIGRPPNASGKWQLRLWCKRLERADARWQIEEA